MGFLFFKTAKEKERAERRERRHALRKAEGAVDEVSERIKKMEKDAESEWDRARDATREGKQAAAQRALTSYRSAQVLITKLEQKKWVFKQVLMKLETAGTDAEFVYNGISDVPFSSKTPACELHVKMKRINWGFEEGLEGLTARVEPISREPVGEVEEKVLYPFGCPKLRLTEIPVLKD